MNVHSACVTNVENIINRHCNKKKNDYSFPLPTAGSRLKHRNSCVESFHRNALDERYSIGRQSKFICLSRARVKQRDSPRRGAAGQRRGLQKKSEIKGLKGLYTTADGARRHNAKAGTRGTKLVYWLMHDRPPRVHELIRYSVHAAIGVFPRDDNGSVAREAAGNPRWKAGR